MRRVALLATAVAAAVALPAAAHGPEGRGDHGRGFGPDGMMEMMHEFGARGPGDMMREYHGPGMMGGYGPGMMGGTCMMQGYGSMGAGPLGGMGHFGMSGAMFDRIDENGDGVVSPEEARAAHDARLKEFDADGDGTLSIDEFEKLHTAAIRELMVDRFQFLDADGDGKVTQEEMNAPIDRMARFLRMQGARGPMMGGPDSDDDIRPRRRMDDDDMPRQHMDPDDMPGMGNGGMMRN